MIQRLKVTADIDRDGAAISELADGLDRIMSELDVALAAKASSLCGDPSIRYRAVADPQALKLGLVGSGQ